MLSHNLTRQKVRDELKQKLSEHGMVHICKAGLVFTLLMTGAMGNFNKQLAIMDLVLNYVKGKYSSIEVMRTDENYYCLVLLPIDKK